MLYMESIYALYALYGKHRNLQKEGHPYSFRNIILKYFVCINTITMTLFMVGMPTLQTWPRSSRKHIVCPEIGSVYPDLHCLWLVPKLELFFSSKIYSQLIYCFLLNQKSKNQSNKKNK